MTSTIAVEHEVDTAGALAADAWSDGGRTVESVPRTLAKAPGVRAEDDLAAAGRKILRFHFDRIRAREGGVRSGNDPEDVHAMRVATRRSRAAWRLLGDSFGGTPTKEHRQRLRDLGRLLGEVRDLDVLLKATEAYQASLSAARREGLEPLVAAWRADREEARTRLVANLDADWYRDWVAEYEAFTDVERGVDDGVLMATGRVRDMLPALIWTAYGHVRAYEPAFHGADLTTLHALRIASKRLRYTLEFGREVMDPDSAALIARVVALQDHLGLLNDARVGASLASAFLSECAGRLSARQATAIRHYVGWREREIERLRRSAGRPWHRVVGLPFRRALGRLTADL